MTVISLVNCLLSYAVYLRPTGDIRDIETNVKMLLILVGLHSTSLISCITISKSANLVLQNKTIRITIYYFQRYYKVMWLVY